MEITRIQHRLEAQSWVSLPVEIRLLILTTIAEQKYPGWASFASVCREWQHVLEKVNFHKLKLGLSCLDGFRAIISPQKQELIRHIYFDIELPRYKPACCCSAPRSQSTDIDDIINTIVSDGILTLFSILSTWRPANDLALELNVYSPSDCEHWFKNIYLSSDEVEHDADVSTDASRAVILYDDPKHGWLHGQQVESPRRSAINQLFRPTWVLLGDLLPRVPAVTCLIIRRQLRRCIAPLGLGDLLMSLNRLEHISYEPWVPPTDRACHGPGLYNAMRYQLPDTLIRLIIFEDSYQFYDPFAPMRSAHTLWLHFTRPGRDLEAVFASKSLDLQHLAISFMINAEELFRHCQSTWNWPHLQSLALTSQLLQDNSEREQIGALLRLAGVIVQKMPKIHTLVLWNGGRGHACAFIYRIDGDRASVTWRGTWHLELSPLVVEPWQRAAAKLPYPELQLKHESIREVIRSHGDAIYHLKLPCQVIEPASLWQIRREALNRA